MPDRDQRKQIIANMRVSVKQRDMTDGEARMFWRTFLDETADIDLQTFEQASKRVIRQCEWFPTVAEFRGIAAQVRQLAGPTRAELVEQQRQELLPPPRWTQDEVDAARAQINPNSALAKTLHRALNAVNVEGTENG